MSKIDKEQIDELVIQAQKGDTDAFAAVYDELVSPIYRYVYFRVNKDDVEDLVELVFLKAWENIHKYKKKKKTSFSSWVFRIAHNLVIDHYRTHKETAELDVNIPSYDREHNPIARAEKALDEENLRKALSFLKDNYKQVLVLKFLEDLSNKEIAKVMKKSEGSLRILQMRALNALKDVLANMGIQY
jgi:RNA polymerase sigma-70 factor, ECF subfamily